VEKVKKNLELARKQIAVEYFTCFFYRNPLNIFSMYFSQVCFIYFKNEMKELEDRSIGKTRNTKYLNFIEKSSIFIFHCFEFYKKKNFCNKCPIQSYVNLVSDFQIWQIFNEFYQVNHEIEIYCLLDTFLKNPRRQCKVFWIPVKYVTFDIHKTESYVSMYEHPK
jgi:hypothetical protein